MNIHHICIFFVCIFLSLHSAEQPMTTEHSNAEQCLVCLHSCKSMARTSFSESIIENFSSPISTVCQGLLVIAQTSEHLWIFAIIVEVANDNKVKVHLCNNHTLCEYNKKNMRQLRLLLSFIWQPEQPKVRAVSTIQSFLERFKKTDANPYMQAFCINPKTTIYVIGDIHGSSKSLLIFLKNLNFNNKLDHDFKLQPDTYIVCTGDYADRGSHGVRVWHMICMLKLINPTQVFLIRGNHEAFGIQPQGFVHEWSEIVQAHPTIANMQLLEDLFSSLPQAVFLGIKDPRSAQEHPVHHFLMFCHGGIDYAIPVQKMLKEYSALIRTATNPVLMQYPFNYRIPELSGLLWSDFVANSDESEPALSRASGRGECILKFNSTAASTYLREQSSGDPENTFDINALFRGHQHIPGGISRLRKVQLHNSDWIPLTHNTPEYIEQGSVYTCISSPEGLADFDCFEDSFAQIEWSETQWRVTPYIFSRIPRKILKKIRASHGHH